MELHLPLGISFFTFQAMSLLVDVYRGTPASKNILQTGLYISMFPQLIAGPIVRFNEVREQIITRNETFDRFVSGIQLFILGLGQKVLIADVLASTADATFGAAPAELSIALAWFGLFCFSLQIYYDFAGYSNMAIGLGRMFGFELPRNFEHPYSAISFQEFWRRWHMTLSRWFRDYLYIPLGGSRGGNLMTYRNLFIVFVLCGIWHGAAWTFLFWGLWHGAFLVFERLVPGVPLPAIMKRPLGMLYVFVFVSLGWVLFRAENMAHAMGYMEALFGISERDGSLTLIISLKTQIVFIVGLLLAWDKPTRYVEKLSLQIVAQNRLPNVSILSLCKWGGISVIYTLSFIAVAANTHTPFLYFRF